MPKFVNAHRIKHTIMLFKKKGMVMVFLHTSVENKKYSFKKVDHKA